MDFRAPIALAGAFAISAGVSAAAPAIAQVELDDELDARLDQLGEELDDEFADWGEIEDVDVAPPPDDDADEPVADPRDDLPPAFYDARTWPRADLDRPLSLGPGMFEGRAALATDLSADSALETVSLAPNLHYGVTERLSLGLIHTRFATLTPPDEGEAPGIASLGSHGQAAPAVRAGDGLCLGDGCARFYDNLGLDVRLALGAMRGTIQLRANAGMEATNFRPVRLGGRVGVTGRLRLRDAALLVDPAIRVGLLRRGDGNDDVLSLPVTAQLQATPYLVVEISSGVYGPLQGFRGGLQVPLSFGLLASVSSAVDVGVSAGFPGVAGGDQAPGADVRMAALLFAYRW
jgi:hypothetical protein